MQDKDHGPIQPQYVEAMKKVGRVIDSTFGNQKGKPHVGWALLTFPFGQGDGQRINYMSNSQREDMIAAMKEFIARAEGRMVEFNPSKVNPV